MELQQRTKSRHYGEEKEGENIWVSGFKVGIIKNKKSNSENSKRLKAPSIKLRLDADRGLCASVNSG